MRAISRSQTTQHPFANDPTQRSTGAGDNLNYDSPLLFIALGVVGASCLRCKNKSKIPLYVPENGFISLNVPLTPSRTGSLSTRTTHPNYMSSLQEIFDAVAIPVKLKNPHQMETKGEMLLPFKSDVQVKKWVKKSVSCGKMGRKMRWENGLARCWKEDSTHCGKCVPCLIRRAAFYKAGTVDNTGYEWDNLSQYKEEIDVLAFRKAIVRFDKSSPRLALLRSAPFSTKLHLLDQYVDVYKRGTEEVRSFFQDVHKI